MDTTYSRKEIRKEIFALILPIIMENVFQVSASLVTVAMIGRLSPLDISAQGIVMRITETLNSLFRGVAIGSTVYIAKAYGAKSMDQCFKVFKQTLISAVPMAILFGSVLFALPTQFLRILTDSSELLTVGAGYMRLTVMGLPFVAIMALVTSAFQGHSNTKTPMMIAMLVNISNIVLGYVLIFGVGSSLRLFLSNWNGLLRDKLAWGLNANLSITELRNIWCKKRRKFQENEIFLRFLF